MKKFRRVPVYSAPGKTNVKEAQGRAGVYLIYKGPQLRYIGHSASNVYKALLRHFQQWDDPKQIRITYPQTPEFKVSIVFTTSQQAARLEKMLITKKNPVDNPEKYELFTAKAADRRTYETFLETPTGPAPF